MTQKKGSNMNKTKRNNPYIRTINLTSSPTDSNNELEKDRYLDRGLEEIVNRGVFPDSSVKFLKNRLPEKMSTVLMNYARPLLDDIDLTDKEVFESTIRIAIAIWNYSICRASKDKNQEGLISMEKQIQYLFENDEERDILRAMLDRKRSLYPDKKMYIIDYNIEWVEETAHLTVASL